MRRRVKKREEARERLKLARHPCCHLASFGVEKREEARERLKLCFFLRKVFHRMVEKREEARERLKPSIARYGATLIIMAWKRGKRRVSD